MSVDADRSRHLERGRRFWDRTAKWDRKESRVSRMQQAQWDSAVEKLQLSPGDVVLDLGCGTGHAFATLREAVGDTGRIIGVDYSPKMVAAAAAMIEARGWDNVEVRRVDASTDDLGSETYDAALASMSLGAMPDVDAAVDKLHRALRPGARAWVCDMAFGPHPLTRLLRAFYRRVMTGNGEDVEAAVARRFDGIEPIVDPKGRLLAGPTRPRNWPPYTYFVATKV